MRIVAEPHHRKLFSHPEAGIAAREKFEQPGSAEMMHVLDPTLLFQGAPDLRSLLLDDQFLAKLGSNGEASQSASQLRDSLAAVLAHHTSGYPLYIFGYGSLMWNPGLELDGSEPASVRGWHRSFCLRNLVGRGGPDSPGLMLALDQGGSCEGVLLRMAADKVDAEMPLLWRREMTWGCYRACWVTANSDGRCVNALTFVANRDHARYEAHLPLCRAARMINSGHGSLGSCRAYFDATLQRLHELGIKDAGMEHLRREVHGLT